MKRKEVSWEGIKANSDKITWGKKKKIVNGEGPLVGEYVNTIWVECLLA